MSSIQKKSMITVLVLVVLISMTGALGFGRAILNKSNSAFEVPPAGSSSYSGTMALNTTIEGYIIAGAGLYLKSYSFSLLAINGIEMSDLNGVNFVELKNYIDQSITTLELAHETYLNLVNKTNSTSYNTTVINQLRGFAYDAFEVEKGLNGVVFDDVRYFLSSGDVRGVYAESLNRVESILNDLYGIKTLVDGNNLPTNSAIWRLNEKWSNTLLFGQYVAEVFYQIAGQ